MTKILLFVSLFFLITPLNYVLATDNVEKILDILEAEIETTTSSDDPANQDRRALALDQLLQAVDLDPQDYEEKADPILARYIANHKGFTNNYQNFTVDNINENFSKEELTFQDIVQAFGAPDVIWFIEDEDSFEDGIYQAYQIDAWWYSNEERFQAITAEVGSEDKEEVAGKDTKEIKLTWRIPNDDGLFNFGSGFPTDSDLEEAQIFIDYEGFKAVVEE